MQSRSIAVRLAIVLLFSCALAGGACILHRAPANHPVTKSVRRDDIRRAQVWAATDVPTMDLVAGPQGPGSFKPGETITCDYHEQKMNGLSPKFMCAIGGSDKDLIKVKYGRNNPEVYGEMLGTRLLWALGFGADRMYAVRVVCRGCPSSIKEGTKLPSGDRLFDPATVERKATGRDIETTPDQGWAWWELDDVDPKAGGAPIAHRDALKLLAVLMSHSDNKPEQQRLLCIDDDAKKAAEGAPCAHPLMMIQDLGRTFGRADIFFRTPMYANLDRWASTSIWATDGACIGNVYAPFLGTLQRPSITEPGRAFLAGLLDQLRDEQIRDLFTAARVDLRPRNPVRDRELAGADVKPGDARLIDEWVAAFKKKRQEIDNRQCPDAIVR